MSEGGNIIRIIGGKSTWTSEEDMNIIATDGDVTLYSPQRVNIEGEQDGQKFGIYEFEEILGTDNAFIPIIFIDETKNDEYEIVTKEDLTWKSLDKNLDEKFRTPNVKEIKFKKEDKNKVTIKFKVEKGSSKGNDSDGGNIRVKVYDKELKFVETYSVAQNIKYGGSFEFIWDKSKDIHQIQFYADDNDLFFDGGISNVHCGDFRIFVEEEECDCSVYKIDDYLLQGPNVIRTKTGSKVKGNDGIEDIIAIILHRTAGSTITGAISHSKGTHFYVEGSKGTDGEIFQPIKLDKYSNHIMNKTARTAHLEIQTENSIGIEVIGMAYYKKDDELYTIYDTKVKNADSIKLSKAFKGQHKIDGKWIDTDIYWDELTDAQKKSVKCLVVTLLKKYNLTKENIFVHEEIQSKTAGEGGAVKDAIFPLLDECL